jgi:hypothetical protein
MTDLEKLEKAYKLSEKITNSRFKYKYTLTNDEYLYQILFNNEKIESNNIDCLIEKLTLRINA